MATMQPRRQITEKAALFDCAEGPGPLVISAPHVGTYIPADIAEGLNETGLSVRETDFHVHRVFEFARQLDASTLFATHSRFVIDLNRAPDGANLYPGQFETGLCPASDFDQTPIYLGVCPDADEVKRRRETYWLPYHQQLRRLLDAAVARHGYALLIDAHSIRPLIPSLFTGRLPDLNFGLNNGRSASKGLAQAIDHWGSTQDRYSFVIDGRFKGGYTTRYYGEPDRNIHAIQIEIVQDIYLNMATPHLYDARLSAPLSHALKPLVESLLQALPGA